jgi:hypothetical protein
MNKELVTDDLCEARRQTINEKIDGLTRTIIACSATMTAIIVIAEFILTRYHV